MKPLTHFFIGRINNQRAYGWCYARHLPRLPLTLVFFAGTRKIGETKADELRPDIRDRGLHPTGACGFSYTFPEKLDPDTFNRLTIRLKGVGLWLAAVDAADIVRVAEHPVPRIFFMHIPKTAGSTFNAQASLFYPESRVLTHLEAESEEVRFDRPGSSFFASGHLGWLTISAFPDREDLVFYTILREPFSHLHSHLNWIKGIGTDPKSGFFLAHPPVIRNLALRLNRRDRSTKEILRQLVISLDGFEIDFFDNLQTRYFLDYRPERVQADDCLAAIENCRHFKRIGLTEHYDAFLRSFCEDNGFSYLARKRAFNESSIDPFYDHQADEFKEIVLPLVQTDLQLYQHICKIAPR